MAEDKVGLGFVGLGRFANVLADKACQTGKIEIVNCFARTESTRQEFANKFGCRHSASLDELLSDSELEGVAVVTPHSTHSDIICQAASHLAPEIDCEKVGLQREERTRKAAGHG